MNPMQRRVGGRRSESPRDRRNSIWFTSMLAFLAIAPSFAGEATVQRGDLVITFDRHARVEPARRVPVRYEPEVFSGRLQLSQRTRAPGPVRAGESVAILGARDFEEQFEDARILAAEAERRLEVQRQERRIALEQARLAVDRAEFAAEVAKRTLEIFKEHESAKTVEMREIGLQYQRDALKDEREELSQLEKMYKGTSLAEETKDIVLERARRALARSERQSKYWDRDFRNFTEVFHPQETRRVTDAARFADFDLEVARVNARLANVRAELDLAAAERGVRDAGRRAVRLERDKGRLTVTATTDGYWLPQIREEAEAVQPWQTIGEVLEISPMRLRGTLDPAAFRVLERQADGTLVGTVTPVRFTALPELVASARFTEVVTVGTAEAESTAFQFVAAIEGDLSGVMIGLDAIVSGRRTLNGVLLVPDKAISGGPSRPVVKRKTADGEEEVQVRLGPSASGKTVIMEGLSEGDRVVTPDG